MSTLHKPHWPGVASHEQGAKRKVPVDSVLQFYGPNNYWFTYDDAIIWQRIHRRHLEDLGASPNHMLSGDLRDGDTMDELTALRMLRPADRLRTLQVRRRLG